MSHSLFSETPNFVQKKNIVAQIFQSLPSRNEKFLLTKEEYNAITKFHMTLKNQGAQEDKLSHYKKLCQGFKNTADGTRAHGLFITLMEHFRKCCPGFENAHETIFSAPSESPACSPAA